MKDKQCCPEIGSSLEHAIAPVEQKCVTDICHRTGDNSIGRQHRVVSINDKGHNHNSRPSWSDTIGLVGS